MEDIIAEVITMWPLTIDLLFDILFPFSRVFYLQTRKQNRQVGDHRILSWNMGFGYIKSKRPLLLLLFFILLMSTVYISAAELCSFDHNSHKGKNSFHCALGIVTLSMSQVSWTSAIVFSKQTSGYFEDIS